MTTTCINPECNKRTNDPSGVCAGCRIEAFAPRPVVQTATPAPAAEPGPEDHEEETVMAQKKAPVIKEKQCRACGTPYVPTSNVQKDCPSCKTSRKQQAARSTPAQQKKERIPPPTRTMPTSGNGGLRITLDLSEHPELQAQLITQVLDHLRAALPKEAAR